MLASTQELAVSLLSEAGTAEKRKKRRRGGAVHLHGHRPRTNLVLSHPAGKEMLISWGDNDGSEAVQAVVGEWARWHGPTHPAGSRTHVG